MANLSDLLPSYTNVLASPPLILNTDDDSPWAKYVAWRKNVNDIWSTYDQNFLPNGVVKILDDLFTAYSADSINYVGITQDLIRFAFIWIPGGQTAAFGINKIIGLLFPGAQKPSLFDQIMKAAEQMVDQKLETEETNKNLNILNNMQTIINDYTNSMQIMLGKPLFYPGISAAQLVEADRNKGCNTIPLSQLDTAGCNNPTEYPDCVCSNTTDYGNNPPCTPCKCRFNNYVNLFTLTTEPFLNKCLSDLRTNLQNVLTTEHMETYMLSYIPLYSTAVTIYLGLLKSFLSSLHLYDPLDTYKDQRNIIEGKLNSNIIQYTQYIYNLFNTNLPKFENSGQPTVDELNRYTKYTRIITLLALDNVASWSLLDTRYYNMPVNQLTLSRLTFFDIVGTVVPPLPKNQASLMALDFFDPISNRAIINNYYSVFSISYLNRQLSSLQFKTTNCYPSGFKASYYTNNNILSADYGNGSLNKEVITSGSYFNLINSISNQAPTYKLLHIGFYSDPQETNLIAGCESNSTKTSNTASANQRIQAIYPLVFHNHDNLPPGYENAYDTPYPSAYLASTISSDTTTNIVFTSPGINTFPAEQANNLSYKDVVPEFINGTNSLSLSSANSPVTYTINNTKVVLNPTEYKIRLRAAANTDTDTLLYISLNNQTITINVPKTTNVANSIPGRQGNYLLISSNDTISLSPNTNISMSITSTSSTPIILDRIEFIPIVEPLNLVATIPNTQLPPDDGDDGVQYISNVLWTASNNTTGRQAKMNINILDSFTSANATSQFNLGFYLDNQLQRQVQTQSGEHLYPVVDEFNIIKLISQTDPPTDVNIRNENIIINYSGEIYNY